MLKIRVIFHVDKLTFSTLFQYGWEDLTQELVYDLTLLILQYFLPVLVLAYTYSRICLVVWGKRVTSNHDRTYDICRDGTPSRAKKKVSLIKNNELGISCIS